jgi:hypothetical protein
VVEEIHNTNRAILTAQPYSVAVLSFASDFIFHDGVLSYVDSLNREIRLLDVHGSDVKERVIDAQGIISRINERLHNNQRVQESVQISLLHYGSGMLAFLAEDRLVLLDATPGSSSRLRYTTALTSTRNLFVRLDDSNLFYGRRIHNDAGELIWSIRWVGYSTTPITKGTPFFLNGIRGASLGRDVCFEVFNHHLYAVSTVAKEEIEMNNWRSFYNVACIKPGSGSPDLHTIWRRDHMENSIEESRTTISISINEITGKPRILESRVEWHEAWSRNVRTYYEEPLPPVSLTPVIDDLKNLPVPLQGPTEEDRARYQRIGKMVCTDCSRLPWAENQYHTYHSCARAFIKLFTDTETGNLCLQTKFCQADSNMMTVNQEHSCPTQSWPANEDIYLDQLQISSGRITKAMSDDGSMICLVDTNNSEPQLVLINFDPRVRIPYTGNEDGEAKLKSANSGKSVRTMPAMHLLIRKGKWLR